MKGASRSKLQERLHSAYLKLRDFRWKSGVTSNGKPFKAKPTEGERLDADRQRFWTKYAESGSHECWEWTGGKNRAGYGKFKMRGKTRVAHRVAYELHTGEIPALMLVCHTCDNPGCVNPSHLFLGTPQDNMTDKVNKHRQSTGERVKPKKPRWLIGSDCSQSKLSESQVREIRALRRNSGLSLKSIGHEYGVCSQTIHDIVSGWTWRHIK